MSTAVVHTGRVAKPKQRMYKDKFTVKGPAKVKATFATYTIGRGDKITFSTTKGKTMTVVRQPDPDCGELVTVVKPDNMSQSFVADTIGPRSSMIMDFGGFTSMSY